MLLAAGFLGVGDGVEEAKELLDSSYAERVSDPLVDGDQGERAPVLVVVDVGTNQGTNSGGVHVGYAGEIDDEGTSLTGTQRRLKVEQRAENDRTLEPKDALAGLTTVEVFDVERFLRGQSHRKILAFRSSPVY